MVDVPMHEGGGKVPVAGAVDVDDRCGSGREVKTAVLETAEESLEEDHSEMTVAEWASDAAVPTGRGSCGVPTMRQSNGENGKESQKIPVEDTGEGQWGSG